MKRLAVGIALAVLLPNCIQANPVAEEQKSAEQQLRDSIGPWCAEICQHGIDCQQDTSEDCPQQCADFMAVFVDHGDPCVTLGQEVQKCLSSLPVCEQLGADNACTEPASKSYEQCKDAALQHVRTVNEILERKLKGPEADEFKRWLVTVAHRVAEAANEGGLFGFGGERVSEAEKSVIRQIAFALDQPVS